MVRIMARHFWARTTSGDKVHIFVDADLRGTGEKQMPKALCGIPAQPAGIVFQPPQENRCGNCDSAWRDLGKAKRPRRGAKKTESLTTYEPKYKIEDWE